MTEAVNQLAVDHRASTDPRPKGEVHVGAELAGCPQRPSARAAALTSVSNATGTPRADTNGPTRSVLDQPGFGVAVINP